MNDRIHELFNTCVDQLIDIQHRAKRGRRSLNSKGSESVITEHLKTFESLKMLRLSKDKLQQIRHQMRWVVQFKPGLAPFCSLGKKENLERLQAIDVLVNSLL